MCIIQAITNKNSPTIIYLINFNFNLNAFIIEEKYCRKIMKKLLFTAILAVVLQSAQFRILEQNTSLQDSNSYGAISLEASNSYSSTQNTRGLQISSQNLPFGSPLQTYQKRLMSLKYEEYTQSISIENNEVVKIKAKLIELLKQYNLQNLIEVKKNTFDGLDYYSFTFNFYDDFLVKFYIITRNGRIIFIRLPTKLVQLPITSQKILSILKKLKQRQAANGIVINQNPQKLTQTTYLRTGQKIQNFIQYKFVYIINDKPTKFQIIQQSQTGAIQSLTVSDKRYESFFQETMSLLNLDVQTQFLKKYVFQNFKIGFTNQQLRQIKRKTVLVSLQKSVGYYQFKFQKKQNGLINVAKFYFVKDGDSIFKVTDPLQDYLQRIQ